MSEWKHNPTRGLWLLGSIWLVGAWCDRLWRVLDRSVPAWDQADYLNGAMTYWQALQSPHLLDDQWWRSFWLLSSKIPPLTYVLTAPWFELLGPSADAAMLVMLFYSAILLISVYGLGVALFDVSVGLWAAGICQLLPGLYRYRLEYLLDFPLTAIVTFSFWLLTLWKLSSHKKAFPLLSWIWAAAWGLSFGLALMVKQTAIFFLLIPILWAIGETLRHRHWHRLIQLIAGIGLSVFIFGPWYRTNWLLILTSGKRATLDSAIAEGDPALNTLSAWTYYAQILPYLLSWILLIVPLIGLLIYFIRNQRKTRLTRPLSPFIWLAVFLLGGYFLASLNVNKDARYILPLLPVVSLLLAVGLGWRRRTIRWSTVALAALVMGLNLFPFPGGGEVAQILSPRGEHHPYLGQRSPHQQVIREIIKTSPYLRSTLGVLPSTPVINQHNFSFTSGQFGFQVVGRQVGVREQEIQSDARALDWFITKTGDQGSVPPSQAAMVARVEQGSDFKLQRSWQLQDHSTLKLYHRQSPSVEVEPTAATSQVQLRVVVPEASPPGVPIPVTYQWSGAWEQLLGFVLLTWQQENNSALPTPFWLHDHRIGMGALYSGRFKAEDQTFKVTERTAMLPPSDLAPGRYSLKATYLDREGKTTPIAVPPVAITIDPTAAATPAPELDLVTQLRAIAPRLAEGSEGLEPVFAQTARINQYDPDQDYLKQAEQTLTYRLQQQDHQRRDWIYAVILSRVLQQDVDGAIAALKQVIQLDSESPYPYAYLAFVYLYDWQPRAAQAALEPALALNPNLPELQTLSGVAALMQGNLVKAWQKLSPLLETE